MKEMFQVSDAILGFLLFQWILPICKATNFPECDMRIPRGQVTWWCNQYDIPCPYSCDEGYKSHDRVSWLQCSKSGQWIPWSSNSVYGYKFSVEDLCTAKRCSTVISQGTLAAECKAAVGSKCNFSCDLGYLRNISVSEIMCQTSTEWIPDIRSLCIRLDGQQCPYDIAKGHLKQGCIREPGHSCTFECIEGYNTSLSPSIITCGSNLKWNHDLTTLCQVPECNMQIPHGQVTWWCKHHPPCPYSCDEGYKSHDRVSWLQCSTSGQWIPWSSNSVYGGNFSVEDLCTAKPCPTVISQGTLAAECKAAVGSKCNFSCDLGYVRNISVSELTCQTSTEWIPDIRSLCIRLDGQQCPYDIAKGHLRQGCIREPGHSCTFECIEGYNTSLSPSIITCGSNLKWNHDLTTLCKVPECDMQIPHGHMPWWCKHYPPCPYSCDEGYKSHDRVSRLQCSTSGQWIPWSSNSVHGDNFSVEDLCTEKSCSTVISQGTLTAGCIAVVGSKCNFSCDLGYVRNVSVSELTCQTSTEWNPDIRHLCIRPDRQQCPYDIAKGHFSQGCIREPGHSCIFECIEGYNTSPSRSVVTCGTNLKWNHDLAKLCQVQQTSASSEQSHSSVGVIAGITTAVVVVLLIIAAIVVIISKRQSVKRSARNVPRDSGGFCLRIRENSLQSCTTIREYTDTDGIHSASSFGPPSYNGLDISSFVQKVPAISRHCTYHEPPPSYRDTQNATDELPPTYMEVLTDPTRFNLYI